MISILFMGGLIEFLMQALPGHGVCFSFFTTLLNKGQFSRMMLVQYIIISGETSQRDLRGLNCGFEVFALLVCSSQEVPPIKIAVV